MAMTEMPPGSGLPAWAWSSYDWVAVLVVAAAIGSLLAGIVSRARPGCIGGHRPHVVTVAAAAALLAAWVTAAGLASVAPQGDTFCFTPAVWVGEAAATCVPYRPVWLLAAPLAVAIALACAGAAVGLPARARWLALALICVVAAAVALSVGAPIAVVKTSVFDAGGITSIRDALARLAIDPIPAGLGLVIAATLIVMPRRRRTD